MDPIEIIKQFYPPDTALYHTLVDHSRRVAKKSLDIADKNARLQPDRDFIEKAAMLHDIGIFLTRAESIGCTGDAPYIRHGVMGRGLLDDLGLQRKFGLVCERHTGAGITKENIIVHHLPLPKRDMVPVSLEEKIICIADKFFSKNPKQKNKTPTVDQVFFELEKIHPDHAQRFLEWTKQIHI